MKEQEKGLGELELDESYFVARRVRGKRGRGAGGKTSVFGLYEKEFARGKSHVNGIECFWSYAKRRFSKFNGLTDEKFILHLKGSEARFNHKDDDFAAFVAKLFFIKK